MKNCWIHIKISFMYLIGKCDSAIAYQLIIGIMYLSINVTTRLPFYTKSYRNTCDLHHVSLIHLNLQIIESMNLVNVNQIYVSLFYAIIVNLNYTKFMVKRVCWTPFKFT